MQGGGNDIMFHFHSILETRCANCNGEQALAELCQAQLKLAFFRYWFWHLESLRFMVRCLQWLVNGWLGILTIQLTSAELSWNWRIVCNLNRIISPSSAMINYYFFLVQTSFRNYNIPFYSWWNKRVIKAPYANFRQSKSWIIPFTIILINATI